MWAWNFFSFLLGVPHIRKTFVRIFVRLGALFTIIFFGFHAMIQIQMAIQFRLKVKEVGTLVTFVFCKTFGNDGLVWMPVLVM